MTPAPYAASSIKFNKDDPIPRRITFKENPMACRLIILSLCTILMPWLSSCHQSKGSESDGAGAMSCGPGEMYLHTRQVCTKIEVLETTDHPECLGDKKFLVRYDQKTACMDLNFKPHLEDCLTDGVDHSSCVYFTKL